MDAATMETVARVTTAIGAILGVIGIGRIDMLDRDPYRGVRAAIEVRRSFESGSGGAKLWDHIILDEMAGIPSQRNRFHVRQSFWLLATALGFLAIGYAMMSTAETSVGRDAGWRLNLAIGAAGFTVLSIFAAIHALVIDCKRRKVPALLTDEQCGIAQYPEGLGVTSPPAFAPEPASQAAEAPSEPPSGAPGDSGDIGVV